MQMNSFEQAIDYFTRASSVLCDMIKTMMLLERCQILNKGQMKFIHQ